mmetsp:Transcript_34893/g.104393  ORF Transcript_34893/g.104393 Transcript_34893/m.104393 type:complete len:237 (-) Transcript_34893:238-948(-)
MGRPLHCGAPPAPARAEVRFLLHRLHSAGAVVRQREGRILAGDVHPLEVPGAPGHGVSRPAEQACNLPALVPPRHGAPLLLAGLHPRRRAWLVVLLDELLRPCVHVPLLRRHGRPRHPQDLCPMVDFHHHRADHADGRRRHCHPLGSVVVGQGQGLPPAPVHVLPGGCHVRELPRPLCGPLHRQVLRPLQALRHRPLHGRVVCRLRGHVPRRPLRQGTAGVSAEQWGRPRRDQRQG